MKIKTVRWTSDEKKGEVHFYLKGKKEKYLCGFSTEFFDEGEFRRIFKKLKKK